MTIAAAAAPTTPENKQTAKDLGGEKKTVPKQEAAEKVEDLSAQFEQRMAARRRAIIESELSFAKFEKAIESINYHFGWQVHFRLDSIFDSWMFDIRGIPDDTPEEAIIFHAWDKWQALKARKGQVNEHFVYVGGVEHKSYFPLKDNYFHYAKVYFVEDCYDQKWRWSTDLQTPLGGSYAPTFNDKRFVDTREEALINGINEILKDFEGKTNCRFSTKLEEEFAKKLVPMLTEAKFVIQHGVRQPSLFG